jgi:drug/metabolite transporter (DMT)-like permease
MLAPFSYSQIIWSMLSGIFIFGTIPGFFTGVGAAIVVASGLYVFHRERIIKGQAR